MTARRQGPRGIRPISSADYEWIFEAMPIPVLLLGPELGVLAVNNAYLKATGTSRPKLLGKALFDALPGGFPSPASVAAADIRQSIARVIENGRAESIALDSRHTSGASQPAPKGKAMLVHAPLVDDQGAINYIVQYIAEIPNEQPPDTVATSHARQPAPAAHATGPREQSERTDPCLAPDNVPENLLVIDRNWRITIVNHRAAALHGRSIDTMLGQDIRDYFDASVIDAVAHVMAQQHPVNIEYCAINGSHWWDLHMSPVPLGGVSILMADITERKKTTEEQLHAARHDPLTGLPNRKLFHEDAERALSWSSRMGHRLAMLFIDLDNFKPVNDIHGHAIGDRLLKLVADRLTLLLRGADLIGRYGGDEFTVLLVGIDDVDDVSHVAENIREALARPYQVDHISLHITASMGISVFPEDGETLDTLIRHADSAMYESKNAGRDKFRIYRGGKTALSLSDTQPQARENSMESRVRAALEAGEFSLVFQPVFNTATSEVVEAEALIRWRQRDGSQIHPEVFLPIAELTGLIKPIGEWLLNTACNQHRRWKAEGLPGISIAVKIPGAQFRHKDFVDSVTRVLLESGLPPSRLVLEISEQTVLGNTEESTRIMRALKALGVTVAITNFGAGNSNVRSLSQLPVDKLKVDRSFMQHSYTSGEKFAATDAIIGLGHSLHKEIVAHGIENEADMAYVRSQGCQYSQGYLLAPPMPAADFSRWWQHSAASGHIRRH